MKYVIVKNQTATLHIEQQCIVTNAIRTKSPLIITTKA